MAGIVFSVIGAFVTGIGIYKQQKNDLVKDHRIEKFQKDAARDFLSLKETGANTLEKTEMISSKLTKSRDPEVLLTAVGIDNDQYVFRIENVGCSTAEVVELSLDYSVPGGKRMIQHKQLISGRETIIKSDVLPHYSDLIDPQTEGLIKWKKGYDEYINKFKKGEKSFIVKINLTYYSNDAEKRNEKYILIHSLGDDMRWHKD